MLNYIPTKEQSEQDRRVKDAMAATPVVAPEPANDVIAKEMATHPPGCNCAVHLQYRGRAIGAK